MKNLVLYGNQETTLLEVEKIVDRIPNLQVHVCFVAREFNSLHHYRDLDYVVFVGICPESELKVALLLGAKVFTVLVNNVHDNCVFASNVKTAQELPRLEKELKNFFNPTVPDLKLVKHLG